MRVGLKALGPGRYHVRWHVLSVDTHKTEGSFSFTSAASERDPQAGRSRGRGVNDPLIYVRAIHFAATITVAGVVFFIVFVAEPAFRNAKNGARLPVIVRRQLTWIAWVGLAVAVVSGAAWLVAAGAVDER